MSKSEPLDRPFPKVAVRNNVCCQSDRHGAKLLLMVLHDTEGANVPHSARDLVGLGNFFDTWSTQASSTVANDEDGQSARYVPDGRKAWTQAYYNPWSLSIEQIGFASDDWNSTKKNAQIHETARWLARWNRLHGVPLQQAYVRVDGTITRAGVCQHRGLGVLGGGHVDVSKLYPLARVIRLARRYVVAQNDWIKANGRHSDE